MRADVAVAERRPLGERARKGLDRVVEQPAGQRIEDHEKADEDDHLVQHRSLLDRTDDDPFECHPAHERDRDGREEGGPIGPARGDQPPGDVGAEHRHLALGEIEVVGSLIDHDHGERDQGVDAADRHPGRKLLQEQVHPRPRSVQA
jgi:hypothetical protein